MPKYRNYSELAAIALWAFSRHKLIDWVAMLGEGALYCFALSGLAIILNRVWPAK